MNKVNDENRNFIIEQAPFDSDPDFSTAILAQRLPQIAQLPQSIIFHPENCRKVASATPN